MNGVTAEALRYLGVSVEISHGVTLWRDIKEFAPRKKADARLLQMVEDGIEAMSVVAARHVLVFLTAAEVMGHFRSRGLASALKGCDRAVLLAATLGPEADRLIRRAEVADMARAVVLNACAAAMIEAYCDTVQRQIDGAGVMRYSPGYDDFSLSSQRQMLALTDAERQIGLYLTKGGMLVPTKSVTAVIGLGADAGDVACGRCTRCAMAECQYRKEPTEWS